MVHGFTQNGRCWEPIADHLADDNEVMLVDAPGHGFSLHDEASLEDSGSLILDVGKPGTYVGYSMGGRMLLHSALAEAEAEAEAESDSDSDSDEFEGKIEQLVLIGVTAGLEDAADRQARIESDEQLAQSLESDGLKSFLERWLAMPMFEGLSDEAAAVSFRMGNRPAGLAASLRNCGTGTQAPLWDRLASITIPTIVVVGDEDEKFGPVANRLVEAIGDNAVVVELSGGHAVHSESPDAMLELLSDLLED